MKVIHLSMECYPMAKAGGMGDVVGALPIYLNHSEHIDSCVLIPKYYNSWTLERTWRTVFFASFALGSRVVHISIDRLESENMGYELYAINIPGLFDRPGVYADPNGSYYADEVQRVLAYQIAALKWLSSWDDREGLLLHCHDHHTGLVPFMKKYCHEYHHLREIPVLFTIHNGRYHGSFDWSEVYQFPAFDAIHSGMLDWSGSINSLAAAIKCCTFFNTVSAGYLKELMQFSDGLEVLIRHEARKSSGILNGIDNHIWDPRSDKYLEVILKKKLSVFKRKSKKIICKLTGTSEKLPLFVFIGRLVYEKGAEFLPEMIRYICRDGQAACVLLGTGEKQVEHHLSKLEEEVDNFKAVISYDERLAHQLYAGMDYLLMPSRVEPCGLNQMYAMRYGSIPVVRRTGGLADSVIDIESEKGYGITFDNMDLGEMARASKRAIDLYADTDKFEKVRQRCFELDFSWEKSTDDYIQLYTNILKT